MTTNEKIQYYRKKLGLSQEELGQKLLVSRQTVSLWENGQTAPTIDNLVRLKEIFGVSVDELLGCENKTEAEEVNTPIESYEFTLSKEEVSTIFKSILKKIYAPLIIPLFLLPIAFLVCLLFDSSVLLIGILIGLFSTYIFVSTHMVITFIKSWKNRQQQQLETGRSKYKVYDDYFVCEENLDGGYITTKKIYFSEIDKIHETDRFLLVVISNQVYILKKSDLINNSAFYLAIHDKPAKFMDKEKIRKLTLTANVFFAMSLIVAITAAVLMFIDKELRFIPWLFLSPLPLAPFICTVFGFTLKRKGCKYKKHIAAGVISVLVLLSTGSFSGLLADFHDPVKYLTDVIGIDMPETSVEQNVISYNYENQPSEIGFIFYHTKVEFEEFSADDFEDNMIYDTRWLTSLPDELKTALKPIEYNESHKGADRIMLYNEFTGEFNTRPEDSELQSFIAVFYFTDENRAEIFEYEYDFSLQQTE